MYSSKSSNKEIKNNNQISLQDHKGKLFNIKVNLFTIDVYYTKKFSIVIDVLAPDEKSAKIKAIDKAKMYDYRNPLYVELYDAP